MAFFNAKLLFFIIILMVTSAFTVPIMHFVLPRRLFSISETIVGTKMERFLILGTKCGKKKK